MKLGIRAALVLLCISVGLVVAGVAMIYPPLAFIVGGLSLGGLVLWGVEV